MRTRRTRRAAIVTLTYIVMASNMASACPVTTPTASQIAPSYALEQPTSPSRAVQTGLLTVRADDSGRLKEIRIVRASRTTVGPGTVVRGAGHMSSTSDLPLSPRLAPKDPKATNVTRNRTMAYVRGTAPARASSFTRVANATTMSVNTSSPYLTGLKPWWTYVSDTIPGVGSYNLNASSGNLLIQSTDLSITVCICAHALHHVFVASFRERSR